jgi:protein-tyrosine phosphatase
MNSFLGRTVMMATLFLLLIFATSCCESFVVRQETMIRSGRESRLVAGNIFLGRSQADYTRGSLQIMSSTKSALHNFGPVSDRDTMLHTAERPGNPDKKTDTVSNKKVEEWISFMKERGISKVVALLDENEITGVYSDLTGLYQAGGLQCTVQPMSEEGASKKILSILRVAAAAQEKVVVHCTGGVGRAGRVAAAWLVDRYGLTAEEATKETLARATLTGINRKGDAAMLMDWMEK